ncbi:MAG: nitrate reductase [Pseudoduganella sp.]|jgi:nitrate reductase NapE|nr:nitrate reductase [Pseudoduganella sp.]
MVINMENKEPVATKAQELKVFLFMTVVLAPILAVVTVGGYGFVVWMYQLLTGSLPGA